MSFPPAKHGCRIEKTKEPPGAQRAADRSDRGVEVVDIGQAEVAGCRVEPALAEGSLNGHVSVDVADAQRLVLLGLCGFADQGCGDIDPRYLGPPARQLAADASVPAGYVQDTQPRDRSQQV
jgi:hypothetical protein